MFERHHEILQNDYKLQSRVFKGLGKLECFYKLSNTVYKVIFLEMGVGIFSDFKKTVVFYFLYNFLRGK